MKLEMKKVLETLNAIFVRDEWMLSKLSPISLQLPLLCKNLFDLNAYKRAFYLLTSRAKWQML